MIAKQVLTFGLGLTFGGLAMTASAVPVVFSGADSGAGPGVAHPLSDAAAASFNAAAPPTNTITFESATTGNFTSLAVANGVTATLTNNDTTQAGISADNTAAAVGFNTTVGGTKFIRVSPGSLPATLPALLTFSFTTPINAFGFYLTGAETGFTGALTLDFNDGTSQSLSITKNAAAGTQFFGFTDVGASIASVTLTETGPFPTIRDIVGVDDVRYRSVPEPTGLAIVAGAALLFSRRRRR